MSGIDTQNVIKIAKHALRRSKGLPDKRLMHPRREWGSGLIMFIVVLVLGSAYTAHLFTQFRSIDTLEGDPGVAIPRYNEGHIEAVLAQYKAREQTYKALVNDRSLAATLVTEDTTTTTEDERTSDEETDVDEEVSTDAVDDAPVTEGE